MAGFDIIIIIILGGRCQQGPGGLDWRVRSMSYGVHVDPTRPVGIGSLGRSVGGFSRLSLLGVSDGGVCACVWDASTSTRSRTSASLLGLVLPTASCVVFG